MADLKPGLACKSVKNEDIYLKLSGYNHKDLLRSLRTPDQN